MAIYKTPKADLRKKYPLYLQVGLLVSLGLVIAAFTVPLDGGETVVMMDDSQEIIELEDIEQTQQIQPPPPPPPAPPPPQEVPDDVEIEEEILEDVELDLEDVPPPPPAPPAPPPPPPNAPPPPPPPPPPEPEPTEPEIFEVAEVQPVLVGGIEDLQRRVEYPEFARRAGIEGQVVVQFVVDERGNVVDPVAVRSPNELLSEAAIKAVRESRFTPGQQRGRPVKVRFAVPVTFRLR
ncbi:energy transducer TonB [Rubrivirga sp. IMCC45206]|uniref:energy transducer TonB n=1 Tax=Rubrivirga sp. IMCC45206 TaxID=3391614 RepID=UPI00399016DC